MQYMNIISNRWTLDASVCHQHIKSSRLYKFALGLSDFSIAGVIHCFVLDSSHEKSYLGEAWVKSNFNVAAKSTIGFINVDFSANLVSVYIK